MRVFILGLVVLLVSTAKSFGQSETLPAIAREVYAPKPVVRVPVAPAVAVPAAPVRAVTEQVVTEAAPPVAVAERTVVGEQAVVPSRIVTWWDAFARNRYGHYDDGYLDDNWYYDYYELPRAAPAAVVVDRAVGTVPGHRTTWMYEPVAERGLFSW